MRSWTVLVLAAVGGGCYSPDVAACLYRCNGTSCPAGLVCTDLGMCASSRDDQCAAVGDDGGPSIDADPEECVWSASNVDACEVGDAATGHWTSGAATIFAQGGSVTISPPAPAGVRMMQLPQGEYVIAARAISIDGPLQIEADFPVILLAKETALVSGEITWRPTNVDQFCQGLGGNDLGGSATGGGGGGAGYAQEGGSGGVAATGGGQPGGPQGTENLIPLRLGCAGGTGGSMSGNTAGGFGGGGLQISARDSLTVSGKINLPGGGGAASGVARAGGGGGGAGGALLLESKTVTLTSTAALCANGGGGGGINGPGSDGQCAITPALGGPGTSSSLGVGGSGGARGEAPGNGEQGNVTTVGGGGGGGSTGRIRINGALGTDGALVTPAYTPGSAP